MILRPRGLALVCALLLCAGALPLFAAGALSGGTARVGEVLEAAASLFVGRAPARSSAATARNVRNALTSQKPPRHLVSPRVLGCGNATGAISFGQTVNGTLAAGDCTNPFDGTLYDAYSFDGVAGQQVVIDMTSTAFDAYLYLMRPGETSISPDPAVTVQDDDSGGGTNARVTYTLAASGTYTILADSYGNGITPGGTGPYTLTLTQVCTYSLPAALRTVGASGGPFTDAYTTGAGCPAPAVVSNSPFIAAGTATTPDAAGNGTFSYTVAPNTGAQRTGSLSVADQTFTVKQSPFSPGTLQLSSAAYSVGEGAGSLTVTVTRANGSDGAVAVSYATSNGSATAGSDYTAASGSVSFADGETQKTFSVAISDDNVVEGDETFTVALSNPTGGATLGSPASATVTINDNDTCSYVLSPASRSVGASGGTFGDSYLTLVGCPAPTLSSNSAFITAGTASAPDGSGNGSFSYTVAANTGAARAGTLTVGGQTFTVNQSAGPGVLQFSSTTYTVGEGGASVTLTVNRTTAAGGAISVSYATANGTATAGSDYTSASGTLNFADGETQKTFSIPVLEDAAVEGDEAFTVTLSNPTNGATLGSPSSATVTITDNDTCSFSINPTGHNSPASGDSGSVNVTAPVGCSWTAVRNDTWITVTSGAGGSANGTVGYTVAANPNSAQRTGTVTIAGQTFTVTQAGVACTFSLTPTSQSFGASGGTGNFGVTAAAQDCQWTAASNDIWITVTGGTPGTGNGTVGFSVAANTNSASRSGTITAAGQTFTVTQTGVTCTFTLAPTSQSFGHAGGSDTVSVTASAPDCAWTAASNDAWITITAGGVAGGPAQRPRAQIFGDSIGAGLVNGFDNGTSFYTYLRNDLGLDTPAQTYAFGGYAAGDNLPNYFNYSTRGAAEHLILEYGANDMKTAAPYFGGDAGVLAQYGYEQEAHAAWLAVPDAYKAAATDPAKLTYTGTSWHTGALAGRASDSLDHANPPAVESAKVQGTVNGTVAYVWIGMNAAGAAPAQFTVKIDGAPQGTFNTALPAGKAAGQYANSWGEAARVLRFAGLAAGDHAVVVETVPQPGVANNFVFYGMGGNGGASASVYVLKPFVLRNSATYPLAGIDESRVTTFGQKVTDLAASLRADGLKVFAVNANPYLDPATDFTDGLHLSLAGHRHVANAVEASMAANNQGVNLGSGTVAYTVGANSGPARVGTMTIAGQTFTVNQSAAPGVLQFSAPTYTVGEGGVSVTLNVTRTTASGGAVSVSYATANGSAAAGSDYTSSSGTLNFADGETTKQITVGILEDGAVEGDETFTVALSNPTGGATLGSPSTATVTITDNDTCSFSINPTSHQSPASGDSGSVNVTAPVGCSWTAVSNDGWIGVTSGAGGNGGGTVGYTVAANTGTARTGTVTVAGQTFTVTQDFATYKISGHVSDASNGNSALAGVTVTLSGSAGGTTTTDANGNYSFQNLAAGGDYIVTPSKANYSFAPASVLVSNLLSDQTADFTGTLGSVTLSGHVSDASNGNSALAGVTVTLSGSVSGVATTDAQGDYSFSVAAGGSYTVTPARAHYTFSPTAQSFPNMVVDQVANFAGTLQTHTISGHVADGTNAPLSGVTVTLSGGLNTSTTTNANGDYTFASVPAGRNYTVTPSKQNYTFAPTSRTLTDLGANQTADFTATLNNYTISGHVTIGGSALSGVTVALTGSTTGSTSTDAQGFYTFTVAAAGNYTVTPSKTNYTFAPPSQTFNNLSASQTADFAATLNNYTISGHVSAGSSPLSGVSVALTGSSTGTTTTDANGNYSFNVAAAGSYTVTPSKQNYTFTPPSRTFNNLGGNQTGDFSASLVNYTISGQVTGGGVGLSGVSVALTGDASQTTTTDGAGNYSFTVAAAGNYTVKPADTALYSFASQSVTNLSANQQLNFAGTLRNYPISGTITRGGNALSGVTVTLSGDQSATTATDAQGNYSFASLAAGKNYTVTPAKANHTFAPASATFNNLTSNQTANFAATLNSYTISGHIADGANAPLSGVTVTLSGGANGTTQTDASGNYSFASLLAEATYTVTPAKTNYAFTPASRTFANLSANQTADFAATLNSYSVSGHVAAGGSALSGVTITLSGSSTGTTQTDANGNYSFNVAGGGSYTLTPSKTNYTFAPPSQTFNNIGGNQTADFAATLNNYAISGHVAAGGNALSGVSVALAGSATGSVQTDAQGFYTFTVAAGGNYTVTPSKTNYTFAPASQTFNNVSANQTADFAATLVTFSISGRVADANNAGLSGVTVALTGSATGSTQTDGNGNYSFASLAAGGSYTVTPSKQNYTFAPPSRTFNNLGANQSADFTAAPVTYAISGRVADASNNALAGVSVALTGSSSATTTTDAQGNYSFAAVAAGGTYTVTPSKSFYTFAPASRTFANLAANQTGADFSATLNTYTVGGRVTLSSTGDPLSGVVVTMSGGASASATTDGNGNYSLTAVPGGASVTITPAKANFTFAPASRAINIDGDRPGIDFAATAVAATLQFSQAQYTVTESAGRAVLTVTRAGNTSAPVSVDVRTVDNTAAVPCGDTTSLPGVAFARCDYATTIETLTFAAGETEKTFSVPIIDDSWVEPAETFPLALSNPTGGAQLGQQATASVAVTDNDAPGQPNPIFQTDFFVRMQYLDFLSREPEQGQPWSNVLNNCAAGDTSCDRVSVSANFFRSQEFQLKGLFVFRFYKVALNRMPLYTEIVADMRAVTGTTTAEVQQKKAAFTNAFAQRAEFTNLYGATTNQQYVDALMGRYNLQLITTPNPATPDDASSKIVLMRADLVARLNASTLTRAQVLRAVADSDEVGAAEFNPAFVAMQYFGYLRRDPEPQGYADWLRTINANPSDVRSMVNGFMNSQEYRLRFGQP